MPPPAATTTPCDCLIVGGGPAGAALAWLLAGSGHRVVLVDDGRARPSGPLESLLPNAATMLQRLGLLELVTTAAANDALRHGSIWGIDELRWRPAEHGGLQLRRGAFDAALRQAAADRGVVVIDRARVSGDLGRATSSGVEVDQQGRRSRWLPRVVVVATGRNPKKANVPLRVVHSGPATLALTFVGPFVAPPPRAARVEDSEGVAVVEATATGWCWLQSPRDGPTCVAVLLDAEGDRPAMQRARAMLAACQGPASSMVAAPLRHAVDATARCVATDEPVLLVGDAAATIDPLASQGVEKAFAAADHAAAVVRTILRDDRFATEMRDEHRRWEHGLWSAHRRQGAAFHAAESRFASMAFWRARHADDAGESAASRSTDDPTAPMRVASGVRRVAAWRRLGDTFEPCDGAELGSQRLTHLGFVPIGPLLDAFATPATSEIALQRVGRDPRCFVLSPFAVQQALRELGQRGWLTRDGGPDSR